VRKQEIIPSQSITYLDPGKLYMNFSGGCSSGSSTALYRLGSPLSDRRQGPAVTR